MGVGEGRGLVKVIHARRHQEREGAISPTSSVRFTPAANETLKGTKLLFDSNILSIVHTLLPRRLLHCPGSTLAEECQIPSSAS